MMTALSNLAGTDNPCLGVKKKKETPRDVWLDEAGLPKFVKPLATVQAPHGDLIRFLTVSGRRISEASMLTWNMVDLDAGHGRGARCRIGAGACLRHVPVKSGSVRHSAGWDVV
ncbi:hypothetical protein [Mesorhizobium sp. CN2-181]|uniref:hypothetical protein n=1 Tax=Mesorhizobium yinganensis TaxID=3157707 RepID=UPI0032B82BB4